MATDGMRKLEQIQKDRKKWREADHEAALMGDATFDELANWTVADWRLFPVTIIPPWEEDDYIMGETLTVRMVDKTYTAFTFTSAPDLAEFIKDLTDAYERLHRRQKSKYVEDDTDA